MKKYLLSVFSILVSISLFSQEKVYFPLFEVININYGYQYSAAKLFKTYADNNNKYIIILPAKPDSVYKQETFAETRQIAKLNSAPYFLTGELNALNDVMIVSMTLYKTEDGKKMWSDMLKARTPDDLDPILQRLAKSMGTNIKAAENGDIYSVSEYESKELDKITANYNFGIFVGGTANTYPDLSNAFSGGFGIKFSYDTRNIIMNINGEYYFGDLNLYDFNLSTLYPLKKGKNTPFVGAGLGYGGNSIKDKYYDHWGTTYYDVIKENGLLIFIHAGYIINRTANAHLQAGVSLCIPTYKLYGSDPVCGMINIAFLF